MIITLVLVYIIPDHNHWFENFEYNKIYREKSIPMTAL